ncbi:Alanine-anticapsin ligase BacD [Nonomuraea coxensis DSM 45129]|uniref:Alanine-anticapsin ligase BacD n=1 Tax=Nonomuraea coxensis DSM 45129 TaxID=1122611 RepID=A0ABX8U3Z3_9ACTN|nr:ATP-grasp domain-containing protein [Nonomuraea coxensis]QYC41611.1 Alanine-anticapsin ligase BacD [Nonomuraea coxensis DSM 45129]
MNLVFVESNTTGSGMLALRRAAALGLTPVLATADPSRYRGLAATGARTLVCDTGGDGLAGTLREQVGDLAGVTTTSEFYVTLAARAAAELGLPGNPPQAMAACRDKGRTRRLLAAARLPSPVFRFVDGRGDLKTQVLAALSCIALPCVVKPVDDTGSYGVRLCSTAHEAVAAVEAIVRAPVNVRGQPAAATALVEGYLSGPEFSLEMLSSGERHECAGIVAKRVTSPPHFVERGHVFPAPLPAPDAATLVETARRALTAVGVTHGVTHVEMKLIDGRGYVVEINARPAGGMIPAVIARSCGFDLLDAHLRAAVGLPYPSLPEAFTPTGIAFLLAPECLNGQEAVLREVRGVREARRVPGVAEVTVTAAPGARVRAARSSYDRLGYAIAGAPTHAGLDRALERALSSLKLTLDPTRGSA